MVDRREIEVRRLAEQLLGPVDEVIHQPYGHAGITFEVRSSFGETILKTRDDLTAFGHTEHHIEVLGGLGIPTPEVIDKGVFGGFSYLLLRKIPGKDLGHVLGDMTRRQMTRLAERVVEIERRVTTLAPGTGFGWTPMAIPGPFASWTAVITRDSASSPAEVRREVQRWKPTFDAVEPTCFLDDLTVKNVIVLDGELQGIVDLDEVCYGDPLYWLSLAEVTAVLDVGLEASFYGDELRRLWGMTEEAAAVCNLYNAMQAWTFIDRGLGGEALRTWAIERLLRSRRFP